MPIINPLNINDFSNGSLVHNRTTATLASANWVDNSGVYTQTISVPNMTSTATVWVSPQYDATTNYTQMYATDQIVPISQTADYITFRRYAASSSGDIEINIVWVEQGASGSQTVVLASADWVNGSQTKSIPSISASTYVWVSPDDTVSNIEAYCNAQIYCSNQTNGSLTFTYAGTPPTTDIPVNVVWMDMVAQGSASNIKVVPATLDASGISFTTHTIADICNYAANGVPTKIFLSTNGMYLDVTTASISSGVYTLYAQNISPMTSGTFTITGFGSNAYTGAETSIDIADIYTGDVSIT